jgi:2'-5' RNA ligase
MANLPMPEGVTKSDLECVMLDVEPLHVLSAYGMDINQDDLFFGDIPELKYAQGPVGEVGAHVTLLFGIHPSETYFEDVMKALEGWVPDDVMIREVGHFNIKVDGEEKCKAIVAHVIPSANLLAARKRLEELDFSTEFTEYKPHVTLAYIKSSADVDTWVRRLNVAYSRRVLTPTALNLGLEEKQ